MELSEILYNKAEYIETVKFEPFRPLRELACFVFYASRLLRQKRALWCHELCLSVQKYSLMRFWIKFIFFISLCIIYTGFWQQGEQTVGVVRESEHRLKWQSKQQNKQLNCSFTKHRCVSGSVAMFPVFFQTIVMNDCIIRGDLANVRVGRHCVIKSRSVIRPPFKKFSKG